MLKKTVLIVLIFTTALLTAGDNQSQQKQKILQGSRPSLVKHAIGNINAYSSEPLIMVGKNILTHSSELLVVAGISTLFACRYYKKPNVIRYVYAGRAVVVLGLCDYLVK